MLFNQKEFEHKIDETKLKKGLKLFLKNKIELINKTGNNSFTFLIHEKNIGEISVQINAEKILNYNCFCGNENYCEHLAAANFYLQQEVLGLTKAKGVTDKNVRGKSNINRSNKNKKNNFGKYINLIKANIKPFMNFPKLKSNQVNEVYKKINFEKSGAATFSHDFYFSLALICELPKLPNYNYSDSKNAIENLIKNSIQEIEFYFNKGLSTDEKDAFVEATYYSLKSQQNFRSGMYAFLVSHSSVIINNKVDFENLKNLLKKRKQNKNNAGSIDRKIIAELQLSIRETALINKTYLLKNFESTLELPIALAEIEFHKGNNTKAFKLLEQYGEKLKVGNVNKYLDLVIEVLVCAKRYGNKKYENKYLLEKFVYGYFIDEMELKRFFELNASENAEIVIFELIKKLKNESVFFTFEKIAVILLHHNKLDELVEEIKKEKNKFKLLNEIGIKKAPQYNLDFLALYTKHFLTAIAEAKFPYFQQQLFDLAKTYLDLLPIETKKDLVETFKHKMLYEKHMVEYITKLYPVPF
jgi:hypothetical protein